MGTDQGINLFQMLPEGRAVAQGSGLALDDRQIVAPVVDGLTYPPYEWRVQRFDESMEGGSADYVLIHISCIYDIQHIERYY